MDDAFDHEMMDDLWNQVHASQGNASVPGDYGMFNSPAAAFEVMPGVSQMTDMGSPTESDDEDWPEWNEHKYQVTGTGTSAVNSCPTEVAGVVMRPDGTMLRKAEFKIATPRPDAGTQQCKQPSKCEDPVTPDRLNAADNEAETPVAPKRRRLFGKQVSPPPGPDSEAHHDKNEEPTDAAAEEHNYYLKSAVWCCHLVRCTRHFVTSFFGCTRLAVTPRFG